MSEKWLDAGLNYLGDAGVNIGSMNLGRRAKGGEAMVVLSVDTPVDEATMQALQESIGARFIKTVHMPQ